MKKCFVIGLIMALVPQVGAIAAQRTVDMLIAEKQAKMKKLEKCKGTTKDLKIAGISTLGITAVGVGANIAEAVVLNDYKDKVSKEKKELAKEQQANMDLKAQAQAKAQSAADAERRKICESFGAAWRPLGATGDFCVKTIDAEVEVAKIPEEIQKINSQCKDVAYSNLTDAKQGFWRAQCQGIDVLFDFTNPKCPAKQEFNGVNGKCVDKADAKNGNKDGKDGKDGNQNSDVSKPANTVENHNINGKESQKTCKAGYEYSFAAGDCVEKNSDARDELAKQHDLQTGHSCPKGTRWDDKAYNCVDIVKPKPQVSCKQGMKYDPNTKQCVQNNVYVGEPSHDCPDGGTWVEELGGCASVLPNAQSMQSQQQQDVFQY